LEFILHFGKSVLMVQVSPEKVFYDTNELFGHINYEITEGAGGIVVAHYTAAFCL
jgi:hypothetical protein